METILSSLGKFEYALNHYVREHGLTVPLLETELLRLDYYARSRKLLRKSSRLFSNRAYPDPVRLIEAIHDGTFQLQASLQYEGGLRAEGVGAQCNRRIKNPLTTEGLRGISARLPENLSGLSHQWKREERKQSITSPWKHTGAWRSIFGCMAVWRATIAHMSRRSTGQPVRLVSTQQAAASHGLKHNFAQERYLECIDHGMTHEQALQHTSL